MPAAVIALQVFRPVAPEPFVIARQALAIRRVADQPPAIGRSCYFSVIADFATDGVGGQPGALPLGCGSFDCAGLPVVASAGTFQLFGDIRALLLLDFEPMPPLFIH